MYVVFALSTGHGRCCQMTGEMQTIQQPDMVTCLRKQKIHGQGALDAFRQDRGLAHNDYLHKLKETTFRIF
jgi:hypothetical protein